MMNFNDFERIISPRRLKRYMIACHYNRRKALTLYRLNIRLSDEMFGVVCCFEVALRNAIHNHMAVATSNPHWLRDSIMPGGMFSTLSADDNRAIQKQYRKLYTEGSYDPGHMVAGIEFGTWRYMFSAQKYPLLGTNLIAIFPSLPPDTPGNVYHSNRFIFNQLKETNDLRNRIAHHEPICFIHGVDYINTYYAKKEYNRMKDMLTWMSVDSTEFLRGIENVNKILRKIDNL